MRSFFILLYRVLKLAKTWGLINVFKFTPYEIYYFIKFGFKIFFSINKQELDIEEKGKANSSEYLPTLYYILDKAFSLIKRQLKNSQFIDFGSGASRPLILESKSPPQKVVGVDLSEVNIYKKSHSIF